MTIRTTLITAGLIAASLVSGAAHAALQGRDLNGSAGSFEAYYDTDLDITWLADANYAQTSGYSPTGTMTWANATTWAANLSFYNPLTNQTYADWRLPTTLQPDASCSTQSAGGSQGYYCTGSEMGHLLYSELGGTVGQSVFTNIQDYAYWSATDYAPYTYYAWTFYMVTGNQTAYYKENSFHAWAVSPGDVGVAVAVPEAETYALMLAGLGLIGWRARRRG